MIADSYFQQRFRSAQPFPDSTYYYNKVKRRPAQLIRFLRLGQSTWRIPDFRRGLREKEVFFKAGKLGSEVLVGFKRGEKCRSPSSIFSPEGRGGKKIEPKRFVRSPFREKEGLQPVSKLQKGTKSQFPRKKRKESQIRRAERSSGKCSHRRKCRSM